jgi:signal transduction histidine kinase
MQWFATFIREKKQRIMDEWLASASRLPSAHDLPLPVIADHVPAILDKLADAIEREDATALSLQGLPNLHAALRAREGYDLRQVVSEYRTLRRVILEVFAKDGDIPDTSRPRLAPLRVMNAALDAAIGDAVDQYAIERDRSREMFIGMLGHDLREPLNAIAVGARVLWLRGEELDPQALSIAARIGASAERMERMIQDLLDFARGRLGGGLPIVVAPLDARGLIARTVDEIAQAHPERRIECAACTEAGNFDVRWDGDRVAQAISNLVSNAVTHGGDPIVVDAAPEDHQVTVTIRNRGDIPAEILPTLFAPFNTTTERRKPGAAGIGRDRRRGSLGLGLYIVREIATAHGGSVDAESGGGQTTFRLRLPRHARPT